MKSFSMDIVDKLNSDFDTFYEYLVNAIPEYKTLGEKDMRKLRKKVCKRYSNILHEKEFGNHSLIDYIVMSYSSDLEISKHGHNVIGAIKELIAYCNGIAGQYPNLALKIRTIIKNSLVSIETDVKENNNNDDYINRLNELAFIRYIANCKNLQLVDIEMPLPNSKRVDFVVKNVSGKIIALEVETLQNVKPMDHDDETLLQFLIDRVKDKYNSKVGDLVGEEIENIDAFLIVPVLLFKDGLEDEKLQNAFNNVPNGMFPVMMSCLYKADTGWTYDVFMASQVLQNIRDKGIEPFAL